MLPMCTWPRQPLNQISSCVLCGQTPACRMQVTLEVPAWMRLLPRRAFEAVGSQAMQGVLNSMVPRFLGQLEADYHKWASGDDSRQPVAAGQL